MRKSLHSIRVGMKRTKLVALSLMLMFTVTYSAFAQHADGQPVKIGKVGDFYAGISVEKGRSAVKRSLKTSEGTLSVVINVSKTENGADILLGEVKGSKASNVSFSLENGKLEGLAVMPNEEKAYKYSSDDAGNVYATEVDVHDVLCIDYEQDAKSNTGLSTEAIPPPSSFVYKLQSLPGATAVAYLDFDGEVVTGSRWAGGATINAQPMNLTETQIHDIWKMVSEDLSPFNINVTTDRAVYNAAPMNRRQMNILTITKTAAPSAGGVAYLNSFSRNSNDSPCWTFNTGVKGAGETSSHELGHTFGLSHDGTTTGSAYYGGHGSWAPIMGNSMSRSITHWSRGEYANANMTQDDVAIISNSTNGFGYRADDAGNTVATAKVLNVASNGSVSAAQNSGIIHIRTDVDVYRFTTGGGNVSLSVNPAATHPNLDVLLRLTNASGTTIATANPTGLTASISSNLASGTYYLHVEGTGAGSPLNTGYSDYGSLGQYSISGTVPVGGGGNEPPVVSLTAPANNATFTAPASITISASASDPDGTVTQVAFYNGTTLLNTDTSSPYSFDWTNVTAGTYTITARATDNNGAVTTSAARTVTVTNPTTTCDAPGGLTTSGVTATSATLSWSAVGAAQSYLVWHRKSTDPWTLSQTVTGTSVTLTGLDANTAYQWTVRSNCASGSSGYSSPYPNFTTGTVANQPPVVSLTAPANNASYTAPASIAISASASDPDGSVTQVAFYSGSTLLATDTSSPYSYTWLNVAAGTYTITARATDNNGAVTVSASRTVTVSPNNTNTCSGIAQYAENNGYVAGSRVQNVGNRYECKPWPYSGWCNGAAWAYGPGTGMYWTDAWTLLGSCTSGAAIGAEASAPVMIEDNMLSNAPNPFISSTTVEVVVANAGEVSVKVYDKTGKLVTVLTEGYLSAGTHTFEVDGTALVSDVYIVRYESNDKVIVRKIVKAQ